MADKTVDQKHKQYEEKRALKIAEQEKRNKELREKRSRVRKA